MHHHCSFVFSVAHLSCRACRPSIVWLRRGTANRFFRKQFRSKDEARCVVFLRPTSPVLFCHLFNPPVFHPRAGIGHACRDSRASRCCERDREEASRAAAGISLFIPKGHNLGSLCRYASKKLSFESYRWMGTAWSAPFMVLPRGDCLFL